MSYVDDYIAPVGSQHNFSIGDDGEKWIEQNKGVTPVFYMDAVKDEAASELAGRPIFKEHEQVRIIVSGDQFNQVVHPVDDGIKARFPTQYQKWKDQRIERHIEGTPIRQWPILTPLQVMEFEALNIFSVENLRDVSDANINRTQDLRQWRDKAKAWLGSAQDGALAMKLATENEQLKTDMADLKKQVADLATRAEQAEAGAGRKK